MRYLFLTLLLFTFCAGAQPLPRLIPYNDNGKWGYSDSLGNLVIQPQWDEADIFVSGKAIVTFSKPSGPIRCLIDEKGNYIIAPKLHWNGIIWNGWNNAIFNAQDGLGNYGIIDTNGKILVPFKYQRASRDYTTYMFSKHLNTYYIIAGCKGKEGVIDTQGNALVPFDFHQIEPPYANDDSVKYLEVHGVDKNKVGMVDLKGHTLFSPQYDMIFVHRSFFLTKKNEKYGLYRQEPFSLLLPENYDMIAIISDNIIVVQKGEVYDIVNGKNQTLLPSEKLCFVLYKESNKLNTPDTIVIESEKGRRSLDANTLQPLDDWQKCKHIHRRDTIFGTLECFGGELLNPKVRIGGNDTDRFIKDGITWKIDRLVERNRIYMSVNGRDNNNIPYTAIVDRVGRYILGPVKGSILISEYIIKEQLLIGRSEDSSLISDRILLDTSFSILMISPKFPVYYAFWWQDKPYAVINIDTSQDKYAYRSYSYNGEKVQCKIIGNDDKYVASLSSYNVNDMSDKYGHFVQRFGGYFIATNSLKKKVIIGFDGAIQLPAISGRYEFFRHVSNNMFLVKDKNTYKQRYKLVNRDNKEYFPRLNIESVTSATTDNYMQIGRYPHELEVPGLFKVVLENKDEKHNVFYINSQGKPYTNILQK